jgi:uncharacterized membrane protein YdfJ with MMPL/SSD domain
VLSAIASLVTGHPRRVLVATVAFLAVAAGFGAPVTGMLSVDPDVDFIDPQSESKVSGDALRDATGQSLSPGIIVVLRTPEPVRSDRGRVTLQELVTRIKAEPGVARTASALDDPRPSSPFVSRDGRSSFVAVYAGDGADGEETGKRLDEALSARFPGVKVGGLSIAGPEVGDQVSKDLAKAEALAFPILFLLALVVFRGAIAALLPLFVGLLTIMTTFLGLRLVNEATSLSIFALNLAIGLGLGLAIDYSLFILSRYREEMERDGPGRAALSRTLKTAGKTVIFSSLTVAAAMLSLLVFPQRFLYSMAISGSITALGAGLISLVALPALLMLLGPRVDALAPKRWRHRPVDDQRGFWYRLSHFVMRRPIAVAAATAAVLLVAGIPFTRIQFTGVDASVLPDSAESKQVDTALKTQFPPGPTSPLHVAVTAPSGDRAAVRAYARTLAARDDVAAVEPPRFVGDGTWLVDVSPRSGPLKPQALDLVAAIRAGPAGADALPVRVSGQSARFVDQRSDLAGRLPYALAILAITTLVILFVMTGSVVLPLKAVLMNVLGLSATFGVLVFVFQDGRLEGLLGYQSQGGLEITQPLVLLAIAFGLSTDYGVFLLTRIKEARDAGASNEEAVALGIQRTGRIVTAAALLLVVAIGAFATSQIVFVKQLGIGTAVAVAIDATIVRALLVPALMKLLGERNWWAPRPLARLHARLAVSES